jgi:Cu+-exporting ATPase
MRLNKWAQTTTNVICAFGICLGLSPHRSESGVKERPKAELVEDPVCGLPVDPERALAKADHGSITYYFCAEPCRRQFERNPEDYAD